MDHVVAAAPDAWLVAEFSHGELRMGDDRARLNGHRDALMRRGLSFIRRARRFQAAINVICVMGGASLAGVGGAMDGGLMPDTGNGLLTVKGLCVWFGLGLVFVGGVILLLLQDEAPALLARAAALESEAQRHLDVRDALHARLDSLAQLDLKRLALIDANRSMREALENALLIPAADVPRSLQAMLEAARRFTLASIGFGIDEQWAISIFQVKGDRLVRIAAIRADQLPPAHAARSWARHEGFVGEAWGRDREMIIADSAESGITEAYPVPAPLRRAYDAERYRSMAAIPVRLGSTGIWGVVAASTSCPERFKRDPGNKQVQAVDTVRLIARMTGLTAAAFKRSGH
ncbi:GAF domain-containing protein [Sphingomonas adhaesiva]|uniref:GAF domain-containing protein n=1 Tax=Sphingomonas adhaesiva TaxID=28212 RepID=UPI002FFB7A7D